MWGEDGVVHISSSHFNTEDIIPNSSMINALIVTLFYLQYRTGFLFKRGKEWFHPYSRGDARRHMDQQEDEKKARRLCYQEIVSYQEKNMGHNLRNYASEIEPSNAEMRIPYFHWI